MVEAWTRPGSAADPAAPPTDPGDWDWGGRPDWDDARSSGRTPEGNRAAQAAGQAGPDGRPFRAYWTGPDTWCDPDCVECGGEGAPCCEPPDYPYPGSPEQGPRDTQQGAGSAVEADRGPEGLRGGHGWDWPPSWRGDRRGASTPEPAEAADAGWESGSCASGITGRLIQPGEIHTAFIDGPVFGPWTLRDTTPGPDGLTGAAFAEGVAEPWCGSWTLRDRTPGDAGQAEPPPGGRPPVPVTREDVRARIADIRARQAEPASAPADPPHGPWCGPIHGPRICLTDGDAAFTGPGGSTFALQSDRIVAVAADGSTVERFACARCARRSARSARWAPITRDARVVVRAVTTALSVAAQAGGRVGSAGAAALRAEAHAVAASLRQWPRPVRAVEVCRWVEHTTGAWLRDDEWRAVAAWYLGATRGHRHTRRGATLREGGAYQHDRKVRRDWAQAVAGSPGRSRDESARPGGSVEHGGHPADGATGRGDEPVATPTVPSPAPAGRDVHRLGTAVAAAAVRPLVAVLAEQGRRLVPAALRHRLGRR